jgi:CRP/FNR family transcriptional regulator
VQRRAQGADVERLLATAVKSGPLAQLPEPGRQKLLASAVRVDLPERTVYQSEGDAPRPVLVVAGLLRANVTAPAGRQLTISYMRAGDMIDVMGVLGGPLSARIETVVASTLVMFPTAVVKELASRDIAVALVLARVAIRRLYVMVEELTLHAFGTLRERVGHHLLDLAMDADAADQLVAIATQAELAAATGAARESVARVMRDLTKEGLIRRSGKRIVLTRPERLVEEIEYWRSHRMPVA